MISEEKRKRAQEQAAAAEAAGDESPSELVARFVAVVILCKSAILSLLPPLSPSFLSSSLFPPFFCISLFPLHFPLSSPPLSSSGPESPLKKDAQDASSSPRSPRSTAESPRAERSESFTSRLTSRFVGFRSKNKEEKKKEQPSPTGVLVSRLCFSQLQYRKGFAVSNPKLSLGKRIGLELYCELRKRLLRASSNNCFLSVDFSF